MNIRFISPWLLLAIVVQSTAGAASVSRHSKTASGLSGWLIQDEHIEIQLNPLTQDQVRAFYLGRGFSIELADTISLQCVYQAIIKNVSDDAVSENITMTLSDWKVLDGETQRSLTSKQKWLSYFSDSGVSKQSRLAFRWATFPTQQEFESRGDYGWGMILFGPIERQQFDLQIQWGSR